MSDNASVKSFAIGWSKMRPDNSKGEEVPARRFRIEGCALGVATGS